MRFFEYSLFIFGGDVYINITQEPANAMYSV